MDWRFASVILGSLVLLGITSPTLASDPQAVAAGPQSDPSWSMYWRQISQILPSSWLHRLPPEVLKGEFDREIKPYIVKAPLAESPSGKIISLFSCPGEPEFCLIGSIYIDDRTAPFAQEVLNKHKARGIPVSINMTQQGYLIDGPQQIPANLLASLLWEQGNQIIAIRALSQERQNMLQLATAIAETLLTSAQSQTALTPTSISDVEAPKPSEGYLIAAANSNRVQSDLQDFSNLALLKARFVIREDLRLYTNAVADESPSPPDRDRKYARNAINIQGNTILQDEIEKVRQEFLEKPSPEASEEELNELAGKITEVYVNHGYITSNATPDEEKLANGEPIIRITEGRLGNILVEGESRISEAYIKSRIRLGAGFPFNAANAEEQLQLLKNDPLFQHVEASLRRAEANHSEGESDISRANESDISLYVQEANPFQITLSSDNYSPPSVGSERFGLELKHRNLTGIGDELRGAVNVAVGDSQVYDVAYRIPINSLNGSIQLRALFNENSIVQDQFGEFGIRGQSNLYEFSYRQPLVRKLTREFALSAGFTYQGGQTFIFNDYGMPFGIGPDQEGVSRTSTFSFGQDFLSRDKQGAWFFQSQFEIGTGLLNATLNEHPIPDGRFFSWFAQAQRLQQLGNNNLLLVRGAVQLTPNSLLPSQQFVIGGGQLLRGYRQNARIGDNGFLFTLENQITLDRNAAGESTFKLSPFVDLGAIWNHPDNPNWLPEQTFLASIGAGLYWEVFPGMNVRLDYGYPLVKLDDRGHNLQDAGIYFGIQYQP